MKEITKIKYKEEINQIQESIAEIERIDELNKSLQNSNWLFVHPYNLGYEVSLLEKLLREGNLTEQKIFDIYAKSFLDLRVTSAFVEGFYKKRPFLKDFLHLIDQSIILCLQKDFAGAINTLIPVIEGSIRNYLVSKGKESYKIIKIEDLSKIEFYITNDYVNLQMNYLDEKYLYLKQTSSFFDINQVKSIKKAHQRYINLWIRQLLNYLNNNLYFNTRKDKSIDKLNRHIIFHGFESDIYYSFSNYLRIFNCLNFISWMFGVVNKECSILIDAEETSINNKWLQYLKIVVVSEAMNETKKEIYNNITNEKMSFFEFMNPQLVKHLNKSSIKIKRALKRIDNLF